MMTASIIDLCPEMAPPHERAVAIYDALVVMSNPTAYHAADQRTACMVLRAWGHDGQKRMANDHLAKLNAHYLRMQAERDGAVNVWRRPDGYVPPQDDNRGALMLGHLLTYGGAIGIGLAIGVIIGAIQWGIF